MDLRSKQWFQTNKEISFQHRSSLRAMGHVPESYLGKPIIGIANSWSDFNNCNYPHKQLVEYVKRGVLLAGGYPLEFHTITISADLNKTSDLPYRNLMSMDVEECIRSLPMDGVVLLTECDKTIPAQLMAAASCDIPAIQLAAGHRTSGTFQGKRINYGTDFWKYMDDYKAGLLDEQSLAQLETCMSCSTGGCGVMGTASTMKSVSEILGMMLPGSSSIPSINSNRLSAAEATGKRIVDMVHKDLRPSKLMTESAFQNAIKLVSAIGGSTNAYIHITAIAGRLGIKINLDDYEKLTKDIPLITNLQPSGQFDMDQFYSSGGLGAVIKELLPLMDGTCTTSLGKSLKETYSSFAIADTNVISTIEEPFKKNQGIAVLYGNLAPQGALIKQSACSKNLLEHQGKAVVFNDYEEMLERIDQEDLDVEENSVLILRNCGPVAIGMPEWGMIPIPQKLLKKGIRDMVRISDARMSGTSFGTVILHTAPEAHIGGPLAIVEDGDVIKLDVPGGRLDLLIDQNEFNRRLRNWKRSNPPHVRGYLKLVQDHILQAPEGCDLDFLRPKNKEEAIFIEPIVGRG